MNGLVEGEKTLSFTIKGITYEWTQSELDHLASLIMPYVTPMDRHIFTMFERMTPEDRAHIALLLNP